MNKPIATWTALLLLSMFGLPGELRAQIYVNGSLSTGATTESGVAATPGSTWSEVQHDTGNSTESNTTSGFGAIQGANRLADDFVVPVGQSWTLTSIDMFSYKTGAAATPTPFSAYTLRIWNGRPGDAGATILCGDTTTNVLTSSTDTLIFRIFNTVVPTASTPGTTRRIWRNSLSIPAACAATDFFAAGTYWLDWDSTDTAAGSHFDPSNTVVGSRTSPGFNARQLTVSTGVWADAFDTGNPATAPDVAVDFPFQLFGIGPPLPDFVFADGFE